MIDLYTEEEIRTAFRVKKRMLSIYLAITALVWCANIAVVIMFANRNTPKSVAMFANILLTTVWGGGTLFFFGLKFPLINRFCKMLTNIKRGLKDEIVLKFLAFSDTPVTKDGVEFFTMLMRVKPNKLGLAEGERNVLIEKTRTRPPVDVGDFIKIRSHGNILVSYELMEPEPISNPKAADKANEDEKATGANKGEERVEVEA